MLSTIEKLREINQRCQAAEPLSDEQLRWLGQSLEVFLSHRMHSLDEAVGLRFGRGGVPWWLEEALRKRDAALRELAAAHLSPLTVSGQARRIRELAVRYGASAWLIDRESTWMPARHKGTVNAYLWRAYSSGAPMPISDRHLRNILRR